MDVVKRAGKKEPNFFTQEFKEKQKRRKEERSNKELQ
jgi:hypothetical protein